MIKILNWNVAAYLRLSKEDNDKMESNSIVNQREIIESFLSKNSDLELFDYYIDDGIVVQILKDQILKDCY